MIDSGFRQAVDYVEKIRSTHARLPNRSEFSDWALQYPDRVDTPRHFELETRIDCFPKALTARFGPAPDGSYLVGYWRGEWMEYFASWTNKSKLSFDRRQYYFFGSGYLDVMSVFILAALFMILASKRTFSVGFAFGSRCRSHATKLLQLLQKLSRQAFEEVADEASGGQGEDPGPDNSFDHGPAHGAKSFHRAHAHDRR
jgi:hypothetical protein